jgi:hypothetical protein
VVNGVRRKREFDHHDLATLAGADGGCTPEIPIGQDPSAGAGGDDREPVACGETACPLGQVCCNPSCGVCTPPDGACTTELCDDRSCSDTMNAIRSLVAEHQSCEMDSDCEAVNVSCLPSANSAMPFSSFATRTASAAARLRRVAKSRS